MKKKWNKRKHSRRNARATEQPKSDYNRSIWPLQNKTNKLKLCEKSNEAVETKFENFGNKKIKKKNLNWTVQWVESVRKTSTSTTTNNIPKTTNNRSEVPKSDLLLNEVCKKNTENQREIRQARESKFLIEQLQSGRFYECVRVFEIWFGISLVANPTVVAVKYGENRTVSMTIESIL